MNKFIPLLMILSFSLACDAITVSRTNPNIVVTYTIWAEARSEGRYGMHLVASVIHNRAAKTHVSPDQVCLKRKQFSCWNNVSIKEIKINSNLDQEAWDYASLLSRDIINGRFIPSTSANHYYNPSLCSPSWGNMLKNSFVYKNHKFGTL